MIERFSVSRPLRLRQFPCVFATLLSFRPEPTEFFFRDFIKWLISPHTIHSPERSFLGRVLGNLKWKPPLSYRRLGEYDKSGRHIHADIFAELAEIALKIFIHPDTESCLRHFRYLL